MLFALTPIIRPSHTGSGLGIIDRLVVYHTLDVDE